MACVIPIDTTSGGLYTAWNAWGGSVTGCNAEGKGCTTGWLNQYSLESASVPVVLIGSGPFETPELAFSNASSFAFSLSVQEAVDFWANDSTSTDNLGGMS